MAKRPIPGKQVNLHDEFDAHGDELSEAAVGMRSSQPPPARTSRPPKPAQTFPAVQEPAIEAQSSEPITCGFVGNSLEDAVTSALKAPQHTTQAGGF